MGKGPKERGDAAAATSKKGGKAAAAAASGSPAAAVGGSGQGTYTLEIREGCVALMRFRSRDAMNALLDPLSNAIEGAIANRLGHNFALVDSDRQHAAFRKACGFPKQVRAGARGTAASLWSGGNALCRNLTCTDSHTPHFGTMRAPLSNSP